MDKSVDTFEQNKRFLSTSLRKFKKHLFLPIAQSPLPLFNVEMRFIDTHVDTTLKRGEGVEK